MADTTYISGDHKVADFKMFTDILKAAGDETTLRIRGIASSTIRDRHGDRMERTALKDMEQAANDNLTIFVNHSYNVPEDVIGSAKSAVLRRRNSEQDEDGNPIYDLELEVELDSANPRAVRTYEAIQRGVKLGMSIGAMIPKGGATYDDANNAFIIHHVDLLETSVVSIPANPRSWVGGAVKALRANPEKLENPEVYRKALAEAAGVEPERILTYSEEAEELDRVESLEEPETTEAVEADTNPDVEADAEPDVAESAEDASSQEAPGADPGNEDGAVPESIEEAADPAPEELDLSVLAEATEGVQMLALALNEQLMTAVADLETEKQLRRDAEAQRDEALTAAATVLSQVADIVEQLSRTPIGRKTKFVEAKSSLDQFKGVYGERFLSILSANQE